MGLHLQDQALAKAEQIRHAEWPWRALQAMEAILRAHTLCETSCTQSAPELAERVRTLAVNLLTSLHCVKGSS